MHMSDALVSAAVGATMTVISSGIVGFSIKKINKDELVERKIPMMGVMGAFVFAAQMINFTIPVTGSSGHIGGGILLAALLGPYQALITMVSVLIIQCLFFADGGLMALGSNIFNLGVLSCLIAYPFLYKPIVRKGLTPKRITVASILAVVVGLQLGSLAVVIETTASGITQLPFISFLAVMQPIHLAIGIVEGLVTGAVLSFVYKTRMDILEHVAVKDTYNKRSMKKVLLIFAVSALLIGGYFSLFASSLPDGLEWSIGAVAGTTELEGNSGLHSIAGNIQEKTAVLPDYTFDRKGAEASLGTSTSGVIGGIITLAVAFVIGFVIKFLKKRNMKERSREVEI